MRTVTGISTITRAIVRQGIPFWMNQVKPLLNLINHNGKTVKVFNWNAD
jgi:hypothetical protein